MSKIKDYALLALGAAALSAGSAAVGYLSNKLVKRFVVKENKPKALGTFAIWGQPDSGKTTFIGLLMGRDNSSKKEQTLSKDVKGRVLLTGFFDDDFEIQELVDMPGTKDRLNDWLGLVERSDHVFYMINLKRISEKEYLRKVKLDIEKTSKSRSVSNSKIRRKINVVGTHLDQSKWKELDDSHNILQQDESLREVMELMGDARGYFYPANLLDKSSSTRLIKCVVNDCIN
jgi:hypothetical protein